MIRNDAQRQFALHQAPPAHNAQPLEPAPREGGCEAASQPTRPAPQPSKVVKLSFTPSDEPSKLHTPTAARPPFHPALQYVLVQSYQEGSMSTVSPNATNGSGPGQDHIQEDVPLQITSSWAASSPDGAQRGRNIHGWQTDRVEPERTERGSGSAATKPGYCAACYRPASSTCRRCGVSYYCGKNCQKSHWKYHKRFCTTKQNDPSPLMHKKNRRGRMGLLNIGNTCYMNSGLQCLSHAYPLTRHFISGDFQADLNTDNVLGSNGEVAREYAVLLKELWFGGGDHTAPRSFKRAVDNTKDTFRGRNQHDAQEFMDFLLDMIHEDLNRIRKKEYVDIPDAGDRADHVVATETWGLHKKRNDSVITENFTGMYKTTTVCPQCNTAWRKFDTFNSAQIEMPVQRSKIIEVTVIRKAEAMPDALSRPIKYALPIFTKTSGKDMIKQLRELTGISQDRLLLWETYNNQIYQIIRPDFLAYKLNPPDLMVATEYDPGGSKFIAVVYHRRGAAKKLAKFFGLPIVLAIDETWTIRELKEQLFRQIAHWLKAVPDPQGIASMLDQWKLGQICVGRSQRDGDPVHSFPLRPPTSRSRFALNKVTGRCQLSGLGRR